MILKEKENINIDNLLLEISFYKKSAKIDLVKKAYEFSKKAHSGQKRISGDDYVIHPLSVAFILAGMNLDEETIVAGLLHDVIEDCEVQEKEIEQVFGSVISRLVRGVTKLGEIDFSVYSDDLQKTSESIRARNIESLRKFFLAMAEDIRVVLIKLADRYHNLSTLGALDLDKRRRIAKESLEIFTPLADRLGIGKLKSEMEDLAFKYYLPEEYKKVVQSTKKAFKEREEYLLQMKESLERIFKDESIEADIEGRAKHYYSIYKKLQKKDGDIEKIYDLFAIRIIVSDIANCYKSLGIIHSKFKPLIYRIKDYIAVPKPNGYQSLHTTVFGLGGKITEVQIRTKKMHEEAEKGVAAHWFYDEFKQEKGYSEHKSSFAPKDKIHWIEELLEWQEAADSSEEFMEGLKIDIFKDRIFVFSPKGDVFDLPEGATSVDFAYAVHSQIGDQLVGAKINSKMKPISIPLENRDIVEVLTKKNSPGPKQDWLKFVVTRKAKNRICSFLNRK